jgi:hypothetical protein
LKKSEISSVLIEGRDWQNGETYGPVVPIFSFLLAYFVRFSCWEGKYHE